MLPCCLLDCSPVTWRSPNCCWRKWQSATKHWHYVSFHSENKGEIFAPSLDTATRESLRTFRNSASVWLRITQCFHRREMMTPPSVWDDKCLRFWALACRDDHSQKAARSRRLVPGRYSNCSPPSCASHQQTHLAQRFTSFRKRNHSPLSLWVGSSWENCDLDGIFERLSAAHLSPAAHWCHSRGKLPLWSSCEENWLLLTIKLIRITGNKKKEKKEKKLAAWVIGGKILAKVCPLLVVPCRCCWSGSPKIPAGTLWWCRASGWRWGAPALSWPSGCSALTSLNTNRRREVTFQSSVGFGSLSLLHRLDVTFLSSLSLQTLPHRLLRWNTRCTFIL